MSAFKFHRWDNALKQCIESKKRSSADSKENRWKSDPLLLNQEAHELPPEKQRVAADMIAEAPRELRVRIAGVWKYCFVQWHIYDAGLEALEKKVPLKDGFNDDLLLKDVDSLIALSSGGDLDKTKTAEEWTWGLAEPLPPLGTLEPWNEATAAPLLKDGRAERREGVVAFAEEQYEQALLHFRKGLKIIAPSPPTAIGPHAKLRCDLHKNLAAAALKLKMTRTALQSSTAALAIDGQDPRAWYRQHCALEAMGKTAEAKVALAKAGLVNPTEEATPHPAKSLLLQDDTDDRAELSIRLHARLEPIVFIEVGIDSITAIDMIRHIQAELPDVPIPLTLAFDHPVVHSAATALIHKLNAGDEPVLRARVNNTLWRAMSKALGTDPVQGMVDGRLGHVTWRTLSEQQATEVLTQLLDVYESEAFVQKTRVMAKRANFEQRAFLVNLRPAALEVQKPVLEAWGFPADGEGMRRLECSVVNAALQSTEVSSLLRRVREAQQGGPNGMWAVNMEHNGVELWADCHSLQSLSKYIKADPLGPDRKNTNSIVAAA